MLPSPSNQNYSSGVHHLGEIVVGNVVIGDVLYKFSYTRANRYTCYADVPTWTPVKVETPIKVDAIEDSK